MWLNNLLEVYKQKAPKLKEAGDRFFDHVVIVVCVPDFDSRNHVIAICVIVSTRHMDANIVACVPDFDSRNHVIAICVIVSTRHMDANVNE